MCTDMVEEIMTDLAWFLAWFIFILRFIFILLFMVYRTNSIPGICLLMESGFLLMLNLLRSYK